MNLCEPDECHIVSYSLIIKHLATSDLLFVRVSRFEHTALNIYSDTIEDVAVGIVYFPVLMDARYICVVFSESWPIA